MSRMIAIFTAFVVCAGAEGCSGPKSLRVIVETREPLLDSIELKVATLAANDVIACRFFSNGTMTGLCPVEDQDVPWNSGRRLEIIFYGDDSHEIDVRAKGYDADGRVVTSTRARGLLTERSDDSSLLHVMLKARTEESRRCHIDLGGEGRRHASISLVVLDDVGDGTRRGVVSSDGGMWRVDYRPADREGSCVLNALALPTDGLPCLPGALGIVAGEMNGQSDGEEIAFSCMAQAADKGPASFVRTKWDPRNGSKVVDSHRFSETVTDVGPPTLADLDGDGRLDVAAVASSTVQRAHFLLMWRPSKPDAREPRVGTTSALARYAPIAVRVQNRDGPYDKLLFSSARQFSYDWKLDKLVRSSDGSAAFPPDVGPTGLTASAQTDVQMLEFRANSRSATIAAYSWTSSSAVSSKNLGFFAGENNTSANHALAVGDIDGSGEERVVVAYDGRYRIVSNRGSSIEIPVTGASETGFYIVLLADLDGRPGAELVSYRTSDDRIFAHRFDGTPLVGWPMLVGGAGGRRVAIADLDQDGSAEIVVASSSGLDVISLGPASFDAQRAPWPMPFRDSRQSASTIVKELF